MENTVHQRQLQNTKEARGVSNNQQSGSIYSSLTGRKRAGYMTSGDADADQDNAPDMRQFDTDVPVAGG
jgi:hypothetical protein